MIQEIELLRAFILRGGITRLETIWVSGVLNRLRAMAVEREQLLALKETDKSWDGNGVSV